MRFKTSIMLTLLLFALSAVFARLGMWQLERMEEKAELFARFENAPAMNLDDALAQGERFTRVSGFGRYDTARHFLLDNRIHRGRPGVHVLTPFFTEDGAVVLVNRGWLPLPADRLSLPEIPTSPDLQEISGRLNHAASAGPRLGDADRVDGDSWPQLLTYLDPEPVAGALGTQPSPWLVQLDADRAGGFEGRDWKAAVMEPETHRGYALQWFSLAAAALFIWLVLGIQRGRRAGIKEKETG